MTLDLRELPRNLDLLERIEKASLRMVTQAIYDFKEEARDFFTYEPDFEADIGEDITREALDRLGTSIIPVRLCLPNGMLQERYNPTAKDTFWLVGRNAPTRGEPFRVRISLPRLKQKANWRVQHIQVELPIPFTWDD